MNRLTFEGLVLRALWMLLQAHIIHTSTRLLQWRDESRAYLDNAEEPFVNEEKAAAAAEQMDLHEQTKAVARAEGHIPAVGDLDSPVPNRFDHTKRGFQP